MFQNIKINLNSRTWMTLEVLSSDFPGLRMSSASLTLAASAASMASPLISTALFHQLMVGSCLAPKWSKRVLFCWMDHQKSIFDWYLIPLLSEAVEAGRCYFFENWLIKFKCSNLLNILGTMIQDNYQSFYLSGPFTLARFNMRHPVCVTSIT